MSLVQVQFKNRYHDSFGGRAYTYIADVPLAVGDIVTVPTQYGDGEARVCRINVPESEVASFRDKLRHIEAAPAKAAAPAADPFSEFMK